MVFKPNKIIYNSDKKVCQFEFGEESRAQYFSNSLKDRMIDNNVEFTTSGGNYIVEVKIKERFMEGKGMEIFPLLDTASVTSFAKTLSENSIPITQYTPEKVQLSGSGRKVYLDFPAVGGFGPAEKTNADVLHNMMGNLDYVSADTQLRSHGYVPRLTIPFYSEHIDRVKLFLSADGLQKLDYALNSVKDVDPYKDTSAPVFSAQSSSHGFIQEIISHPRSRSSSFAEKTDRTAAPSNGKEGFNR